MPELSGRSINWNHFLHYWYPITFADGALLLLHKRSVIEFLFNTSLCLKTIDYYLFNNYDCLVKHFYSFIDLEWAACKTNIFWLMPLHYSGHCRDFSMYAFHAD